MQLADVRRSALRSLIPPPRLQLSRWIEENIVLPASVSALPGKVRLFQYQRAIADAIGDPNYERVTVVKSVRVGFSSLAVAAVGSFVANDPCGVLVLAPTESDCRDMVVSEIEPLFNATPALRGALSADKNEEDRNTLMSRRFPGGSLKIVAARAPRNLRRHTCRVLICDEVDAMEIGPEGNPLRLAERRTLSFPNRKIVVGSTPVFEDSSLVLKAYGESDMRVFEVACPSCGTFNEIMWKDIVWEEGHPETAAYKCPRCSALEPESRKAAMIAAGQWRATRPEIANHAGFRINALVSPLANASWAKLAAEFIAAKDDVNELQTFVNTILAQGWNVGGGEIDDASLAARAEKFGLDAIPVECLVMTAGVDVQDDRLETSLCGWDRKGACMVLGHIVIWGSPDDAGTWAELDELLRTRWRHPLGGPIRVDACAVDSGDGDWTDAVYNFCFPRANRRVYAIKGLGGNRPAMQMSKGKAVKGGHLWIVGVDTVKTTLFSRLRRGEMIRFSHHLEAVYYEQLAAEKRVVRYKAGQPFRRFEKVSTRARSEALDCLAYAFAARQACPVQLDAREERLRGEARQWRSLASRLAR